jgi:hypothetical protein
MTALIIEATDETPQINLDPATNYLSFSGKSLPEDVRSFYTPVLKWIDEFISTRRDNTVVEFKMDYFNTASSKIILDILLKFEQIHLDGYGLLVKWVFKSNDLDMREAGDEYAEIVEVPFEYIPY